jgi:hypothetical protein
MLTEHYVSDSAELKILFSNTRVYISLASLRLRQGQQNLQIVAGSNECQKLITIAYLWYR